MPANSASPSLHEALSQIREIRAQMSDATLFRGYRALTVAATGVLAILAATIQTAWIPDPAERIAEYVFLWVGLAGLCLALVVIQLVQQYLASDSGLVRRNILQAVEKFAPCVLAGALVTTTLLQYAPVHAPLLPGFWATLFSLGIFSSWRKLPKPCLLIGAFYIAAGACMISAAGSANSLSPYGMGITFGVGQLATAAALYFGLERGHGPIEE